MKKVPGDKKCARCKHVRYAHQHHRAGSECSVLRCTCPAYSEWDWLSIAVWGAMLGGSILFWWVVFTIAYSLFGR